MRFINCSCHPNCTFKKLGMGTRSKVWWFVAILISCFFFACGILKKVTATYCTGIGCEVNYFFRFVGRILPLSACLDLIRRNVGAAFEKHGRLQVETQLHRCFQSLEINVEWSREKLSSWQQQVWNLSPRLFQPKVTARDILAHEQLSVDYGGWVAWQMQSTNREASEGGTSTLLPWRRFKQRPPRHTMRTWKICRRRCGRWLGTDYPFLHLVAVCWLDCNCDSARLFPNRLLPPHPSHDFWQKRSRTPKLHGDDFGIQVSVISNIRDASESH